jgi:NAD(P)-dependent dehydrogenase (short-subunit alcohol dehydrogenase family)
VDEYGAALAKDSLAGKLALVTGASRGIGHAVAAELGTAGATVICVARDGDRLDEAVYALRKDGVDAVSAPCDLADGAAVERLPAERRELAEVDILVNAAGVLGPRASKTIQTSYAQWRAVSAVDLEAPFGLCRAFVPGMMARRAGVVVNVTACLGRMSGPGTTGGLAPYRVAKAGLNALTRNLAHELGLGRRGVLVDAVCPGHCRTDLGGPDAPRSVAQGAETILWLTGRTARDADGVLAPTGLLWEDRAVVPW